MSKSPSSMITCQVETDPEFVITPPWHVIPDVCLKELHRRVACDAVFLALFNVSHPSADEVLLTAGVELESLRNWIRRLPGDDVLYRKALDEGLALGPAGASLQPGPGTLIAADNRTGESTGQHHTVYLTTSARFGADIVWFAAFWRDAKSPEFDENEVGSLQRTVLQWASRFNSPHEPDMIRLLIGADDRVILTDPAGEQTLLDLKIDMGEAMTLLRAIVDQRWPDMPSGETHDVVIRLANRIWWVRFHAQRSTILDSRHEQPWYLELRPLEEGEMMPVGLVEDDRVAKALSHIHDRYCESLNLKKISATVGISLFHFHRLFTHHVGVTPKQYILQKQMQVARWMLRAKNAPVSRIAESIGFASHGHFTSTFTRIVGVSPTEYRERQRDR